MVRVTSNEGFFRGWYYIVVSQLDGESLSHQTKAKSCTGESSYGFLLLYFSKMSKTYGVATGGTAIFFCFDFFLVITGKNNNLKKKDYRSGFSHNDQTNLICQPKNRSTSLQKQMISQQKSRKPPMFVFSIYVILFPRFFLVIMIETLNFEVSWKMDTPIHHPFLSMRFSLNHPAIGGPWRAENPHESCCLASLTIPQNLLYSGDNDWNPLFYH